jgi:hypothetical protein
MHSMLKIYCMYGTQGSVGRSLNMYVVYKMRVISVVKKSPSAFSYKNVLRITLDLFVVGNLLYEHREESFLFGSVTKYICRAEYMRVISFPLDIKYIRVHQNMAI